MAGLLDNLPNGGLFDYIRGLDKMTEPYTQNYWSSVNPGDYKAPEGRGTDVLNAIRNFDRWTQSLNGTNRMSALGDLVTKAIDQQPQNESAGLNMAVPQYQAPYVPQNESAGLNMQRPQYQTPQAPPPSWLQSPQMAQAGMAAPTSSYAMGGGNQPVQNVPMFGQPQMPEIPTDVSARPRAVPQGPLAPSVEQPTIQSELFKSPASSFINDLAGRFNPSIQAQNDAKKAQAETARGMFEVFKSQGMSPQEAAARAVIAARNPKVLEEIMKPYVGMEQRLANQPNGANASQAYTDFLTKKNAAEKAGTVQGESQAQAQIDLPGAVSQAKEQLRLLDQLAVHPGRSQIGWHDYAGKVPLIPSTKGYDAENLLNQIKSGAFMTAFQTLKGGGQITEVEGAKATAAIARMDRATSKAEFDKALEDYKGVIQLGVDRASQKAGKDAPFGFKGNTGWYTPADRPNVRIRQVQ